MIGSWVGVWEGVSWILGVGHSTRPSGWNRLHERRGLGWVDRVQAALELCTWYGRVLYSEFGGWGMWCIGDDD